MSETFIVTDKFTTLETIELKFSKCLSNPLHLIQMFKLQTFAYRMQNTAENQGFEVHSFSISVVRVTGQPIYYQTQW